MKENNNSIKTGRDYSKKIIGDNGPAPKNPYPRLYELGVKVHTKPIAHIKGNELKSKLSKPQIKLFNTYFGVQTCPVVDGVGAMYPWDVEAVLHRMFKNELIGSQLLWD